jgi:hypothetical protein
MPCLMPPMATSLLRNSFRRLPGRTLAGLALIAGLGVMVAPAQAARPLATDDAAVNAAAVCQIESWVDRSDGGHATVLAPACGLTDTLELDLEFVRGSPRSAIAQERTIALKWADPDVKLGDWRFGAKLGFTQSREPGASSWGDASRPLLLGLASLSLGEHAAVHLNLGHERRPAERTTAATYGAAFAWTPIEPVLLFAEWNGDNRSAPLRTVGGRWWLLQDTLGLDLTWTRQAATPGSTVVGVGLCWYGIGF